MAKSTKRQMSVADLTVDVNLNVRLRENYDLPTMKDGILSHGRIIKPIIAEKFADCIKVLAGNRRTWAGQELVADPATPKEVVDALKKTEVVLYEGLTENERLNLIADHDEKPLSSTELLMLVYRMDRQLLSAEQIACTLYYQLADYTGNKKKLSEVPNEPGKRKAFIMKWFKGTLVDFMLKSNKCGPFVREQMILTFKSNDRLLQEGESVTMRCNRERIAAIYSAKLADQKDGTWDDANQTGPKFAELIQQYQDEDAGKVETEKVKRPSAKDLKEKADVFKSAGIRKALLIAAGVTGPQVEGLVEEDDKASRDVAVISVLVRYADRLPDYLRQFIGIVTTKTAAEVEAHCKALTTGSDSNSEPAGQPARA